MKVCNSEPLTVKTVFKTTWEIGTAWELRAATSVPRSIQYIEMDLRNKTTSEFRAVFDSPLGVPNSQVPLYIVVGQQLHTGFVAQAFVTTAAKPVWYTPHELVFCAYSIFTD